MIGHGCYTQLITCVYLFIVMPISQPDLPLKFFFVDLVASTFAIIAPRATSTYQAILNSDVLTVFGASWEALFLYDSMIFLMTLNKAYKARHELQHFGVVSMFVIMLRDGMSYYESIIPQSLAFSAHNAAGSIYFG